ncbi:MAG: cold shock domain-containing protein [Bacteroidetes bacterium]|nr:MAG: cold shock domain-containing protein [Bacteroidota bacterium]
MKTGIVKFFNTEKGFGFIKDDESKKDIFVHKSNLNDPIREDDAVSYEVEEGPRGLNAVNVSRR